MLAVLVLWHSAAAQVYVPPPANAAPAASPASAPSSPTPAEPRQAAPLLGNEVPVVDPTAEMVQFNGRTFAIGDNRLFAARYERYLNEPEDRSEEAQEYRATIDEILELMSPHRAGGPSFFAAFQLLPRASTYPGDAKLCDSLSQAIYVAMLSKKNVDGTKKMMEALEAEKQRVIREADWKVAHETDPRLNTASGGGAAADAGTSGNNGKGKAAAAPTKGVGPAQDPGRGQQSLQYLDMKRRIVEIEAVKKKNEVKGEVQIVQAKIQFQALMMQFFLQRRFQHVVMATRFYHQIWNEGDNELRIDKKSDTAKLFNESVGFSPTVASLDSLASEFIRDCDQGVEAFQFLADKGELESASKRLAEAYAIGEFMPGIRTLPRERKRRVLEFVRESNRLLAAINARDYQAASDLTQKLKSMAADFNGNTAETAIATAMRVSNMHLMTAKTHAMAREMEPAREAIKKAMEAWPQNPKLAEFDQMIEAGGAMAQAKLDFDRLLSENNYRQIFQDQYRLAPAIQGDETRMAAFKQIIENLTKIEASIGKANEFSKMGQDYAAWEQLAELRDAFPDDPKLGRELELLAPKVADFTKALDRAQQLEKRNPMQTGSALAWYLKARDIFPQSQLAHKGVERMLDVVLPEDAVNARATAQ